MGHKQPPTPLQTDNAMEDAVFSVKIQPKQQKQLTCNSIGSETDNSKNSSEYIGDQAKQIMHTTGQSTIQQSTTKIQEKIPDTTHHIGNAETGTTTS